MNRRHAWLAGVLAVAAAARLYAIDQDLPLLFEEATPMRVAESMWRPEGGVDPNPRFFNYPSLVIYSNLGAQALVLGAGRLGGSYDGTAGALAAWAADPTPIALAGRLVSVLAGVLAVWALYRLGSRLAGAGTGIAAAAVLALSPWHIGVSRMMLVDVPFVLFVALALTEAVGLARAPSARRGALAGLFVGLAASAKYPGALTAVAVLAAALAGSRAEGLAPWRAFARPAIWVAGAVSIAAFLATSPYVVLDASAFAADLGVERLHMAEGHFGLDPGGAVRAYPLAIWNGLGGWGVPLVVVGLLAALTALRRDGAYLPLLVHGAVFAVVLSTWSMYGAHYLAPVVPVLVVLAGVGLVWTADWGQRRAGRTPVRAAGVALSLLALLVAGAALARHTRPNTRGLAREWLLAHVEPGDAIAYEHRTVDVLADPVLGARARGVRIPMSTLEPERAAPFYDHAWYRGFDYLVVSDHVAARYRAEPARFARQVAFYDSLDVYWRAVTELSPEGRRGPRVTVHAPLAPSPARDAPLPEALVASVAGAGPRVGVRFLGSVGDVYLSRGWSRRAEEVYRQALALEPRAEPILYNLGIARLSAGDLDAAIEAFERARAIDPARAETHNNLGIAHAQKGARAAARAAFRAALAADPAHENARVNLRRLEAEGEGAPGGEAAGAEPEAIYWLTLLHNNDGESKLLDAGAGEETVGGIARFVTVVDSLRAVHAAGGAGSRGLVVVSSGDTYLAGPELAAGLRRDVPFDAIGVHHVGYDALAVGNHELDLGPDVFADFLDFLDALSEGGGPPFVTANLDVGAHPRLRAARAAGRLVASTVVSPGGRRIGIVGATTPMLPYISSPAGLVVDDVAVAVQAEVDALTARGVGVIVLVSHLQDIGRELALAGRLHDVDVIVAGGGDEVLANPGDRLVPGDEAVVAGAYPMLVAGAAGDTIRVVTTAGQYRYVGRLTVGVDDDGRIVRTDRDATGPVRVVAHGVFPDGVSRAPRVVAAVDVPLRAALAEMETTHVARSAVPLEGRRRHVRTEQTNLGCLVADAVRWAAREAAVARGLPVPGIAIHNGGGIRSDTRIAPGDLTELDTFRIVPFPNVVTIVDELSVAGLLAVLENAVSELPTASGRYPQVAGFRFDVDASRAVGGRVRRIVLEDGTEIVRDGEPIEEATLVLATTDFLATGGDEYPLEALPSISTGTSVQMALTGYVRGPLGGVVAGERYAPRGGGE